MMKYGMVVAMVAGGLVAGYAVADDESDARARQELIEDIDEKVEDVGEELAGFEADADVGDLDDALSYAREVVDLVSKLDAVKGDDGRARSIVSQYPGYVEAFRDAARSLKKLQEGQRLADGVADRCVGDDADLQTLIRNYVGSPDDAEDAVTKLPEKGRQYGAIWEPKLAALLEGDQEMTRYAGLARFAASDGEWAGVSASFATAATAIPAYWRERYVAAGKACKNLALAEKHPDIVKAVGDLSTHTGNTKATVTRLKQDYNAWLGEVRTLRGFSDQDRDALRDVMCKAGEYEMKAKVNEVADRWASQIAAVYGTTLGQGDRLAARGTSDKLKKFKGAKQVVEGVAWNLTNLEKLKEGELLGSNNPKIKTRLAWGDKRHDDLQTGLGCTYAEFEIASTYCDNRIRPGSGCRADCVKVSNGICKIIEIKPDSEGAKNEGRTQVEDYMKGLINRYHNDKAGLLKEYDAVSNCENSDKTALKIETEVITYEFCTGIVRDQLGEIMKDVSTDLPEGD